MDRLTDYDLEGIRFRLRQAATLRPKLWRLRHNPAGGWTVLYRWHNDTLAKLADLPERPTMGDVMEVIRGALINHSYRFSSESIVALIDRLTSLAYETGEARG